MCEDFSIKYKEIKFSSEDELKEIIFKSLSSLDVKKWDIVSRMCQSVIDWVKKKLFTF